MHFQVCIFQDQPWNPPDFMDEICQISSWNLLDFMKFTWFHEICWISPWNPPDFMNSGFCCIFLQNQYRYTWIQIYSMVYHWMLYFSSEPKSLAWNPVDFMKSGGFHGHEICQIPCMKSAKFHHEICQISWYTTECCIFHQNQYRYTLWAYYMLNMQCISPCHEIRQISCIWNPPDFMKFAGFHEIRQISCMKSAKFHAWNPPDFMKFVGFHEICWISCMKSARFHEIHWISWNLPDFMKFGGFHVFPKWAKDQWSYFWLIWDTSQWAYAIMIHESKYAWCLCTLLLARVLIFQTSYFADISHNAPS